MNRCCESARTISTPRSKPGVTRMQLQRAPAEHRPVLPDRSRAPTRRIGGMAATRASGTNAVRYGTMRENVLGLTVVLRRRPRRSAPAAARASRRPATTSRACSSAPKARSASSPRSRCGSTAVPRRCRRPSASSTSMEGAVDTVIATMQLGIPVARIELLDEVQMDACNRYSKIELPGGADALLRVPRHASRACAEQAEPMQAIAAEHGGSAFQWATQPEDRSRLWQARHDALLRRAGAASRRAARGRPTSACRSRGSPTACSRRRPTSPAAPFRRAARRPRRRRQLPPVCLLDPDDAAELGAGASGSNERMVHARARDGRHLHRRARHRRAAR